jgi:hypothetical protein
VRRVLVSCLIACAVYAAPAAASSIFYACGSDICRINPDGSARTQVTNDANHRSPSISRDGTHLAWVSGYRDLFTGTASADSPVGPISTTSAGAFMRPDGTQVLDLEVAGQFPGICIFGVGGEKQVCQAGESFITAGWAPDGRVLTDANANGDPAFPGPNRSYQDAICILVSIPDGHCGRIVAYDSDHELTDPTVSPDGSVIAVTAAVPGSAVTGYIALYDYTTGKLLKNLTSGTGDLSPAWSPDGTSLVFSRSGALYTISATGLPGSEKQLVAGGVSPSWGGPTDGAGAGTGTGGGGGTGGGSAPRASAAAIQHGQTIRGSITLPAASKVKVQLVVKTRGNAFVVGSKTITKLSAGKHSFATSLSRTAVKALKNIHTIPITVLITITPNGGSPVTLHKRVALKR